ncbi:hypothetical protein INT45_001415 [Circinella minor]|uniref:Reverse transcriptase domain-containing protein n=1 Tax=Circinella minor TaxID=1195481 RepID=A0A8H7RNH1_9FUNG|nr:hypothetical protein INT45_001415 [Circinella minor]
MSQKKRPRTRPKSHTSNANKSSNDNRPKTTILFIKSIRCSTFSPGATDSTHQNHIRTTEYFRSINPSLFFETTIVTTNRSTIFDAIAQQFPSAPPLGVQLRFKDKRVVIEITPRDEDQRHNLMNIGLKIKDQIIMGTPALRKGSGFMVINLYDLPHKSYDDLTCVSLDVTQSDQTLSTHTLLYPGMDHKIRAFWKGSPPYCHICHEDTHEKDFCPKSKAQHLLACSSCGQYGYTHTVCSKKKPQPKSVNPANKKFDGRMTGPVQPPTKQCSPVYNLELFGNNDDGSNSEYSSAPPSPNISPDMEIDAIDDTTITHLDSSVASSKSVIVTPAVTSGDTSFYPFQQNIITTNDAPSRMVSPTSENSQLSSFNISLESATPTEPNNDSNNVTQSLSLMQTVNSVAAKILGSTYSEAGVRRTLNCRGLPKTAEPQRSKHFIRFLRSQSLDILTLQETHAADADLQSRFHTQFQSSSSFWSQHVGIVSLNPAITLSLNSFYLDGRVMHVTASHLSSFFSPINIFVIYAPACSYQQEPFYTSLSQLSIFSTPSIDRSVLLGEFNYQILSRSPSGIPDIWKTHLSSFWVDCVTSPGCCPTPTFLRHSSRSCLDYIFMSHDLYPYTSSPIIDFINPLWTDHQLVSIELRLGQVPLGPGMWRCNPTLAHNDKFCSELYHMLDNEFSTLPASLSKQQTWDQIKIITGKFAHNYSRKKGTHNRLHLCSLQTERRRYLSLHNNTALHQDSYLLSLEAKIASVQSDMVHIDALRAGLRWCENGERSAGYIKRSIETRQTKRNITQLRHPITDRLCNTSDTMTDAAQQFYQQLYTPEPIDFTAIDHLLQSVLNGLLSSSTTQSFLLSAFTLEQLIDGAKRAPRASSPGSNRLLYPILRLLFEHPLAVRLALNIYNDALHAGVFPASWTATRLCLLPKKGDLSLLSNWRPISLINTDAKVFSRLVNDRVLPAVRPIISPVQTGFLAGKFIGDNGLAARLIMEYARHYRLPGVGILLDQFKAYNRVHPTYLRRVLLHIGLPTLLVLSLCTLFFSTTLSVIVNGFLSGPINQGRGLRQGDPISPVLFNLAFDPLLRMILDDPLFHGVSFNKSLGTLPMQDLLQSVDINAWHDYHSLSAVRYLGYPLASTSSQLNAFLDGLLITLGSKQFHQRIRGLVTQFLMYKMFPPIKYNTLILPKFIGGLGILDSSLQQQAMQL